MNKPRFIVSAGVLEAPDESVVLAGEEARHMTRVLRLGPGDGVTLVDGEGHVADAEIVSCVRDEVALRLTAPPAYVMDALPVELIVSVVKGVRMDWLVQKATELGVRAIRPVVTEHTVVRMDEGKARRRYERWNSIAGQALKQCRGYVVPRILPVTRLEEGVVKLEDGGIRIALQEKGNRSPLLRVVGSGKGSGPVILAVGPEGGFSPHETDLLDRARFVPAGLGRRILRAETAALMAVAVVRAFLDAADHCE